MSWNGFDQLDLSGVEAAGGARLQPGKYIAKCTEAKVTQKEGTSNRMLTLTLEDKDGNGDIRVNLNISHSSEKAQEIALKSLKQYLEEAGHPNPNRPGDVSTLEGLEVGILVGWGKPYTNRDGEQRVNTEVRRFVRTSKAAEWQLGPDGTPSPLAGVGSGSSVKVSSGRTSTRDLDDEIPFAPEWR